MAYSKELKSLIVARLLPPNNDSVEGIHKETGIPIGTLRDWKKSFSRLRGIKPGSAKSLVKLSAQDKFQTVIDTASLNELELAEYCRKKGYFVDQVKLWQSNCAQANGGVTEEAAAIKKHLQAMEIQLAQASRELRRKDAALAEAAALLVLGKKFDAIWGNQEEEA